MLERPSTVFLGESDNRLSRTLEPKTSQPDSVSTGTLNLSLLFSSGSYLFLVHNVPSDRPSVIFSESLW